MVIEEFGLIREPEGLRIYGSGIVSSGGESRYCLDSDAPNRLGFDLLRIPREQIVHRGKPGQSSPAAGASGCAAAPHGVPQ